MAVHECGHPFGPELIIVFEGEVFYFEDFEWLEYEYEWAVN